MKFKYEKIVDYGPKNYQVFVSNRIKINKLAKLFCQSQITKRVNGPGTAFAKVLFQIEWPTNPEQHWGFELMRHFKGKNYFRSAEAWCNYMVNNSPSTLFNTKTHVEYGQEFNLQEEINE